MSGASLVMGGLRERSAVSVVAGLAGFYAGVLVMAGTIMTVLDAVIGSVLGVFSGVFVLIAFYVSGIVITSSVATVIAGRQRRIATLRLLGADVPGLRRRVGGATCASATLGSVLGTAAGVLATDLVRDQLVARGTLPTGDYPWFSALAVVTCAGVVGCAWIAARVGSRRVTTLTPAQALSGPASLPARPARTVRVLVGAVLAVAGIVCALWGATAVEHPGPQRPTFFTAVLGCLLIASAVVVAAPFFVPAVIRLVSRLMGDSPTARLARRNAVADPLRTSRATIGLVIGSGIVVTFNSGFAAVQQALPRMDLPPGQVELARFVLDLMTWFMTSIVVVSAVIAAAGFVSTMTLVVLQRSREIGMLRALGFTTGQVRAMVAREAVALGAVAVLLGTVLGIGFGSVSAQALLGDLVPGFVVGVPVPTLIVVALATVALVVAAAWVPARRATSMPPVQALSAQD